MKTINQIALENNIGYYKVNDVVVKGGFVTAHRVGNRKFYNQYQESCILDVLSLTCCIGKPMFEIYESSMNKEKFKNQKEIEFNEFKKRTYGKDR